MKNRKRTDDRTEPCGSPLLIGLVENSDHLPYQNIQKGNTREKDRKIKSVIG